MIRPELTVATVLEDGGRFLLVEERAHGRVVFNQPAGHVEPGETIAAAARRETLEETGRQVTLQALLGVWYWPHAPSGDSILRCAFSAVIDAHDAARPLDDVIVATHWLSHDELLTRQAQLRSPLVLAAIDAWLDGVRLPLHAIHSLTDA